MECHQPCSPIPSRAASQHAGSSVESVAFSPDGRTLAAGSDDHQTRLWNVTDPARPAQIGLPLTGPTNGVESVVFSPNGHTLASGSTDGTIWLWNIADPAHPAAIGQPLSNPDGDSLDSFDPIESVVFSPNGHTLAAGTYDGTIWLWDDTHPDQATQIGNALTGSTGPVWSVAISPDGHTLAAGTYDGTTRLWDITHPARPVQIGRPLTGPANTINSVAFSPDGHTLAVGVHDDTIWLWNVTDPARATQAGILTAHTGPAASAAFESVAFSPDGHTLAGGSLDDTIQLWNLDVGQAIERICATTSDNLTPGQWARYIPQLPYDPPCRHH